MRVGEFLLLLIALFGFLGFVVWIATLIATRRQGVSRQKLKELAEYEAFVENLREIAYDHRDLDSRLSIIITDEIRAFENRHRKELR